MRHRVAHRKLGRVTEHRISMLRNQATALLRHEHLDDDGPEGEGAAAVRRAADHDRQARRGCRRGKAGRSCNARRLVMHDLQDGEVVTKLFDTLAPRFAARPGGYTRLLRIGFRQAATAPRWRRSSSSAASSIRAPRPTPADGDAAKPKTGASADGFARRPSGCAARREPGDENEAVPKRGGGKGRPDEM